MAEQPLLWLLAIGLDIASGLGFLSRQTSVLPPAGHAGVGNTTLTWHMQTLDHFAFDEQRTFGQRVFTNGDHWGGPGAPILFYCGNEANVELYVNATGLMWESAASLNALLVWAEHRYYGASLPFGNDPKPGPASNYGPGSNYGPDSQNGGSSSKYGSISEYRSSFNYGSGSNYGSSSKSGSGAASRIVPGGEPHATSDWRTNASLLKWLTAEQALADYAQIIYSLRKELGAPESPVIAVGGSYGGMLAAWLRLHYPAAAAGALAASAPVLAFDGMPHPTAAGPPSGITAPAAGGPPSGITTPYAPFDGRRYWAVVSMDASPTAGADPGCAAGVQETWPHLFALAMTEEGRRALTSAFGLCAPLDTGGGEALAALLLNAWDTLAMGDLGPDSGVFFRLKAFLRPQNVTEAVKTHPKVGNFPYASNYLIFQQTEDPTVLLPPWPVRAACAAFAAVAEPPSGIPSAPAAADPALPGTADSPPSSIPAAVPPSSIPAASPLSGIPAATPPSGMPKASPRALSILRAMAAAVGVLYNASGRLPCLELPTDPNFDGIWDWQFCTERLPQETYFELDASTTMFWDRPSPEALIVQHCRRKYGVASRPGWIPSTSDFGSGPSGASNIVFSNGDLDPWSSGGVRTNLSSSVLSFTVKDGAHHLDLMWSNPSDGQSVRDVRNAQLSQVRRWVAEAAARRE